ncbi:hypothetical protein [Microbacterium sulfonylureivorans]|uniref:hypothetical protein n=1 Tax=Microbacterium sulfonylureivorans TaxID=2486854 RepID=UPI000FDC29E2|nr:hypothetical protein [Microbacterium sulfonylureivorans]
MDSAATTAQSVPGASPPTRRAAPAQRGAAPSWAAVAAWGAGLIELALGAGALTGGGAARGAGAALVAVGAAGLVWGATTLGRGRIVVPRSGVVGALAGVIAGTVALAADPARSSVVAFAVSTVLLVAVALACAARLRAVHDGRADAAPPRLSMLFVAAAVVAALVTPALGATEAGRLAPDHGTHGIVDPGHH